MRTMPVMAALALLLTASACRESEQDAAGSRPRAVGGAAAWIVGSWVIDAEAQRDEVARVSPSELEDFGAAFRTNLAPIRETFYPDGRYEVMNRLGGPFEDRWEFVSGDETTVAIRSSGYSWIARRAAIGAQTHDRSSSVLTYTFSDPDHMVVTTRIPVFGEEEDVSYFFVRAN